MRRIHKTYNLTCKVCGHKFASNTPIGKYCSKECFAVARKQQQSRYFKEKYYPEHREEIIKNVLNKRKARANGEN